MLCCNDYSNDPVEPTRSGRIVSAMIEITLEGRHIRGEKSFYQEVEDKLTLDLTWTPGRNLNALNPEHALENLLRS